MSWVFFEEAGRDGDSDDCCCVVTSLDVEGVSSWLLAEDVDRDVRKDSRARRARAEWDSVDLLGVEDSLSLLDSSDERMTTFSWGSCEGDNGGVWGGVLPMGEDIRSSSRFYILYKFFLKVGASL
ncbi:hypothetical protein [Chlamydiifrater volucris]|uniref:hypothetical protein n=1 Tax=Chlamydiifrater volucris TaxID=2681470 RepID=UPI001BCCA407|nr:hypothetical protein [Chlamydiifrater volucris]